LRIDQLVPAFHRGDAIGDSALHMRDVFRSHGFEADIYCLDHDKELAGEARLFSSFPPPGPKDATLLHYALPSPLSQALTRLKSRKILIHHNITPSHFFSPYSVEMARIAHIGRLELASLMPFIDLGLADSEYNRRELVELGCRRAEVLPLYVDFRKYEKPHSVFVHDLYRDDRTNILFVGRIAPNKKIEDLIRLTFYYKKYISPLVRLIVVGKTQSLPAYFESCVRMADEFYLKPEEIVFTGHIPDEEMSAFYRASDVFLSMSEHEGFCLPLIESMVFDLPVVAYDSTAVPFTLDGAGVLFKRKKIDRAAELVDLVARDPELREKILAGQRARLDRFRTADRESVLLNFVAEGA
jgi:L-malate glycosyltransferase